MSQDTAEIRARIEQTRQNLSSDVNALANEADPRTMLRRRTERVRQPVSRFREKVFGSASDAASHAKSGTTGALSSAKDSTTGALGSAKDAAAHTPEKVVQGTQGSPLAAGLIAFGTGLVVAALLPPSEKERRLAARVGEEAQPLVEGAKELASESAEKLKEPLGQAVDSLKETAAEAKSTVTDDAKGAVQEVKSS